MIANYHAHTVRCRHAEGTMEEYVQCAIDRGLQIFGFSDHAPQDFPGNYYSTMRMYPDELPGYCDAVRTLQKKYAGKLQIPLGLEVEYYPALFSTLLSKARDMGVEYMLLGQHWCGNEENEPYNGAPTADTALLERYCDQTIEAMYTGLFTYLAHPDLIYFVGEQKEYQQHMRRLCRAAKQTDTPLEINLLGIRYGRNYPNNAFWEVAAEESCPVIIGIDAHKPVEIQERTAEFSALELVNKYGLPLLETVPLRKI